MSLLPRVYMQRCTHDNGPVLVHGNHRDEIDDDTALMWVGILVEGLRKRMMPGRRTMDIAEAADTLIERAYDNRGKIMFCVGALLVSVLWVI